MTKQKSRSQMENICNFALQWILMLKKWDFMRRHGFTLFGIPTKSQNRLFCTDFFGSLTKNGDFYLGERFLGFKLTFTS